MNENNLFAKILNKTGKEKILIVILIGVLLIVVAMPVKEKDKGTANTSFGEEIDTSFSTYETTVEKRVEEVLKNVKGVGDVKVMVNLEKDDEENTEVTGVIVVAEGGDDAGVASSITSALEALLGIPIHKIKVLKMI